MVWWKNKYPVDYWEGKGGGGGESVLRKTDTKFPNSNSNMQSNLINEIPLSRAILIRIPVDFYNNLTVNNI